MSRSLAGIPPSAVSTRQFCSTPCHRDVAASVPVGTLFNATDFGAAGVNEFRHHPPPPPPPPSSQQRSRTAARNQNDEAASSESELDSKAQIWDRVNQFQHQHPPAPPPPHTLPPSPTTQTRRWMPQSESEPHEQSRIRRRSQGAGWCVSKTTRLDSAALFIAGPARSGLVVSRSE